MPFKSKAQVGKFFAMESRGELPAGTAERWAHETPDIKNLPDRKVRINDYVQKPKQKRKVRFGNV